MERRSFLSAAALLAFWPEKSLGDSLTWAGPIRAKGTPDEEYWKNLRSMFPLDKKKVYLNNGTMGITPYPVLMAVENSYRDIARTGNYPGHNQNLQKAIGDLIGAQPEEIAITKNVSEGTNHACWGIPMKKGDEVILTLHEHVGGCLPWINRARIDGIVIKTVQLGKNAAETLELIASAITKRTKVIAVPHIPCTIGQILPVKEICTLARSKGIISAIDGAHPLGMLQFNVKDIGCDYYYGCIHKWALGPIGVGFFYASNDIIDQTRISHVAAYSTDFFSMAENPPSMGKLLPGAQRFSYGTFCGPGYDGALKALELYSEIGPDHIEKRSRGLASLLQQKILEFGNYTEMLTPEEDISRGCQISFKIKNDKENANQDFISKCREKGIILRYVNENGLDCIRVSTHYYNSEDDIGLLVEEIKNYLG